MSIVLSGECPRCGDHTQEVFPLKVLATVLAGDEVAVAIEGVTVDDTFSVDCDCGRPHAGRKDEDGEKGCGTRWYLHVTGNRSELEIESATPDESPTEADQAAVEKAAAFELEGARKHADTWQKALAGLVALGGTFLFLKGADAPSKLNHAAVIALVAVLGLGFAVFAAFRAADAASGEPVEVDATGPGAAQRIASAQARAARQSIAAIRDAKLATLMALALLVAAILGSWINTKSTTSKMSLTTTTRETPACGDVESGNSSGITLKDANGATMTVNWSDVSGLSLVPDC